MSRKLYKKDILEVLCGATFLGGGGGGTFDFSIQMLQKLEEKGIKIELDLLNLDEIEEDGYATMVAGLGSPIAMIENGFNFGPDAVYAFNAYKKAMEIEGKDLKYLYSGEMGGFNTFVPMMVAILSDENPSKRIKFIDTDANGRAVPELNTCLTSLRGFPPSPIGLGNGIGDEIIAYATSDKSSEVIARQLCMAYNMQIGFATWGLNKNEMEANSVVGCITYAQRVGSAFMKVINDRNLDIIDELNKVMKIREVCRGRIENIETKVEDGFDFGTTTIVSDQGKKFFIDFKNENLLVRNEDGNVLITAPEIIGLIDLDKIEPLTNADIKEGMNLLVAISPADLRWWSEDYKAYECWKPLFELVGYTGEYIRF